MAESVTVEYFGLGTPRLGLWCDECLLPSAYEVDLYLSIGGQPPQVAGIHKGCSECGEDEP